MNFQKDYEMLINVHIRYLEQVKKFNSKNPVKPVEFPDFPECASTHLILKICEMQNNEIKDYKEFGETDLINDSGDRIKCITINNDHVVNLNFRENWEKILILDMSSLAKNSDVGLYIIKKSSSDKIWNSLFLGKVALNEFSFDVDWRHLSMRETIFAGKISEINY